MTFDSGSSDFGSTVLADEDGALLGTGFSIGFVTCALVTTFGFSCKSFEG